MLGPEITKYLTIIVR